MLFYALLQEWWLLVPGYSNDPMGLMLLALQPKVRFAGILLVVK
jgi:hypothetical protein